MNTTQTLKNRMVLTTAFVLSFNAQSLSAQAELAPMRPDLRLKHARELLGDAYKNSPAPRSAGLVSVTRFVYNVIQTKMDVKYRAHAANLSATILNESSRRGLDPIFVLAVIATESQFNPTVIGTSGEIGLMQVKPDTARWIAQKEGIVFKGAATLKNPMVNVRIGIAYMSYLRGKFEGSANRYVAAYNMGPANVRRHIAQATTPREYATR
ncbi:MAG: hypothetical protein EOP06_24060, partial [Proteobacteria bacterium]